MAEVRVVEEGTLARRAVARKEAKGKSEVAGETAERVGLVANWDTLQHGVTGEATKTRTLLVRRRVKSVKKQLTMMERIASVVLVGRERA